MSLRPPLIMNFHCIICKMKILVPVTCYCGTNYPSWKLAIEAGPSRESLSLLQAGSAGVRGGLWGTRQPRAGRTSAWNATCPPCSLQGPPLYLSSSQQKACAPRLHQLRWSWKLEAIRSFKTSLESGNFCHSHELTQVSKEGSSDLPLI